MSEKARLEILQRQQFLRFQGDIRLKKITDTLIRHFQCPIALISLVESANVRFLAISGLEITDIDRNLCFCNHNVLPDSNRFLRIEDARKDARFQGNPLVMGEESLRFYAGIPMMFEGIKIGSVAIIDINPRYDFDSSCLDELRSFHDEVIKILQKGEVMNHQNMDLMNAKEGSLHQLIGNILQTIQHPMESLVQKENRLQELKRSLKQSNSSTNLLNPLLALVGLQKSPKIHDQEEEGDAAVVTVAQQINQLQKEMIETKSMIKNHLQYALESIHRLKQFTDISTKASSTKDEIKENAILDPPSDANQSPIYTCTKDWLDYIYSQIQLRYLSSQIKERSKHHRSRITWKCVQTKEMKLREISNALQESISIVLQFALLLLFPIYEHVYVQVSTIERRSDRHSINGPEEVDIAFTFTPKRKRACKTPQSSIGSDIIAVGYNILATSLLTLPNAHFERRGRNDMLLFRFTCDWRVACGQKTILHCVDSEQEEKGRKEKKMNRKEVFSVTTPTNSISSTHNNSGHTLQRKTRSSNKAGEKYQKEEGDDNEDRSSSFDAPIAYIEEETHLYRSAPISSSSFSLLSFFRFNQVLPAK